MKQRLPSFLFYAALKTSRIAAWSACIFFLFGKDAKQRERAVQWMEDGEIAPLFHSPLKSEAVVGSKRPIVSSQTGMHGRKARGKGQKFRTKSSLA